MSTWPHRLVTYWSERQLGLVRRTQLLEGVPRGTVSDWVASGRLEVVQRGVLRLLAAYGVDGAACAQVPEVVVPRGRRLSNIDFIRRVMDVPEGHRVRVFGCVPGVRLELGVLLEGKGLADHELEALVDRARWTNRLRLDRLLATADEFPFLAASQRVHELHAAGRFVFESPGERDLAGCLGSLGLLFRWQADDVIDGIRFDAYCDLARLALEYDGREDERDKNRDCERDLLAGAQGVLVLHVTRAMLLPANLEATLTRISAVVAERARTRPWER